MNFPSLTDVVKAFTDPYSRKAHLAVVVLVVLPCLLLFIAYFADLILDPKSGLSFESARVAGFFVVIWFGIISIPIQVVRKRGQQLQEKLYAKWGGAPTTIFLRHAQTKNRVLLKRRHEQLSQIIPGCYVPTPDQEADDPQYADEVSR
jgi:hypothetical protein